MKIRIALTVVKVHSPCQSSLAREECLKQMVVEALCRKTRMLRG